MDLRHHLRNREEVLCIKCLDTIKCSDICLPHNGNPFPLDLEGVHPRNIWRHHRPLGRNRLHLDITTLLLP
jgi:hypothetical protein